GAGQVRVHQPVLRRARSLPLLVAALADARLGAYEDGRFLTMPPNYTLKLLVRNPSPRHYPSNWTMRVGGSGCRNRTRGLLGESLVKTARTVAKRSCARS